MSYNPSSISTNNIVNCHISQNGAGAVTNANGDYSGAAVYWEARPGAGVVWRIPRLLGGARDATAFQINGYIAGGALANGVKIEIVRGTGAGATVLQTVEPAIKTWDIMGHNCYDLAFRQGSGAGEHFVHFRWTFSKAGVIFRLDGDQDDAFRITLNDDLRTLTGHNWHVQGMVE